MQDSVIVENKDTQKSGLIIFSLKLPANFEAYRNFAVCQMN